MLTIVESKTGSRPAFRCDFCGKEIDTADSGNCLWHHGEDIPSITYLHKGGCTVAYEDANGTFDACIAIDEFMVYLLYSVKMSDDALRQARIRARALSAFK